ncbi:hypothetical protein L211DRAFT_789466 [Terfezia boudieri ATCC MYA-4762]|uniref:Rhodopsin domain-containing protein n=1 Tax=Terfezia boudieri ATCC MYA-4762 TaxID=1051890 RepID=A0A3N4LMP8_9PEZI|nr:hypothetical protein L211DRAFT_789466 [Terfezia boudieri ATCC MYA-4762]
MDPFTIEVFTLWGVSAVVIGIRTYARWSIVGIRKFQVDDYLMIIACMIYGLETGAGYSVGALFRGMANNGMTDEQRATLVPGSQEWNWRVGGSKIQLIGWSLWSTALWLLKICMAVFYSRLTDGLTVMRDRVRIAYVAIGVTYIAVILSIMLGCLPFHKNWQIYPDPGNHCHPAVSLINVYVPVVFNLVTDLYLMTIPMPLLWRANLTPKRKALLLCMFSGGVFIMMCSILRCYLIVTSPITGAQQAGSWACRETFVAVIIGNVPMIYPLFLRVIKKAGNTINASRLGSSKRSGVSSGAAMELNERDKPSKPLRKKVNPLSIPGLTTLGRGDSEERIIGSRMGKENNIVGISVVTEVTSTSHGHSPTSSADGRHYQHNSTAYGGPSYTVEVAGGDGYTHDGHGPRSPRRPDVTR